MFLIDGAWIDGECLAVEPDRKDLTQSIHQYRNTEFRITTFAFCKILRISGTNIG